MDRSGPGDASSASRRPHADPLTPDDSPTRPDDIHLSSNRRLRQGPEAPRPATTGDLATLVRAQQLVVEAGPGPDEVVQALAEAATILVPHRLVVSTLIGDRLVVRHSAGGVLGFGDGDEIRTEGTLTGLCLRTGETQLCVDVTQDDRSDTEYSLGAGARSSVHVALRHRGTSIGVLSVVSGQPGAFDQADADRLSILGHVGGTALAAALSSAALAGEQLRVRAATRLTGMGLWRWDAGDDQLFWSDRMYEIAGQDRMTVSPNVTLWDSLVHPDDRCTMESHAADGDRGRIEMLRLRAQDGSWRELLSWSRPEMDGDRLVSVFGATMDVTRQRSAEREVARLAVRDQLTGLANRAMVNERVRRAVAALAPSGPAGERPVDDGLTPCVAVMLLDLDRFQLLNDTFGHQVGDALLVEVARRLTDRLEPVAGTDHSATIGRIGGDEFVVVLPWVLGAEAAVGVAEWLLEVVSAPMDLRGVTSSLVSTASVGLALAVAPDRGVTDLFREAELAMYQAKRSGRGRVVLFDGPMRAAALHRVDTELQLRTAIQEDRLVALYQPIVALGSGHARGLGSLRLPARMRGASADHERAAPTVAGVEALVRMRRPDGVLVEPAEFIDVAEDTGLVVRIDRWMLRQAVSQLARWLEDGAPKMTVSVNMSARTLVQPDLDQYVQQVVDEYGVPPDLVLLELTETSLVPGGRVALDAMERLRRVGVATVIDDFGTGYSSLAYLQELPVSCVKIDRSFVSRLGVSRPASAIVRAVVDLAHAHGLMATAEGVEAPEQATLLRDMGCDNAQGWLFGQAGLPGDLPPIVGSPSGHTP